MEMKNDDRLWYEVQIEYPALIDDDFYIMIRTTEEEISELAEYESEFVFDNGVFAQAQNRDMWLVPKYKNLLHSICGFAAQLAYQYSMDSNFDDNEDCASIDNIINAAKIILANSPNAPATLKKHILSKLKWLANFKSESAEKVQETLQSVLFEMNFICFGSVNLEGYDEPDSAYYLLDMN